VSSFTVLRLERWHRVGVVRLEPGDARVRHDRFAMLGWLGIVVAPQLQHSLTRVALTLLVICGVPYTVGAIVLARKPSHPQSDGLRLPRGLAHVRRRRQRLPGRARDAARTSLTGTHQNAQRQRPCPYPKADSPRPVGR
jgi:predicted membrane channel-forming protein YqfA (hemolysin III family)